jgi:hypothetical protein
MAQAVMRSITNNAAKGNVRTQRLFTEMVGSTEASRKQENLELYEKVIDFKLLWEKEFKRCEQLGLPAPEPIPHPDDVIFDPRTGSVHFKGPVTKEEKANLDFLKQQKAIWEAEVALLEKSLRRTKNLERRAQLEGELADGLELLELLSR